MFSAADETDDWHSVATTVFELAGQDTAGLLADVTQLLTSNGCDVRSAAVRGCVASDSPCMPVTVFGLLHTMRASAEPVMCRSTVDLFNVQV